MYMNTVKYLSPFSTQNHHQHTSPPSHSESGISCCYCFVNEGSAQNGSILGVFVVIVKGFREGSTQSGQSNRDILLL